MSKAFTKEDSNQEEEPLEEAIDPLPAGTRNYITPRGLKRLSDELEQLTQVERPKTVEVVQWAASLGDRSENADYIYGKRRLREIDRRIRFLSKRLENIEVIDPAKREAADRVFFGATITVADEAGQEKVYYLVGVDESDPSLGKISWISPIGRALLKAQVDDTVSFESPSGEISLTILKIEYKEIP